MSGRGRSNRRGSNRRRPPVRSQVRSVRRLLHVQETRGRADPPAIVSAPWNRATLVLRESADGVITTGNLAQRWSDQLGLTVPTNGVNIRIEKIRMWEVSGADLEMNLYDRDTGNICNSFADVAGRNRWAHVGCILPSDWQNNAMLVKTSDTVKLCTYNTNSGTGSTEQIIIYIDTLWRSPAGTALPQLLRRNSIVDSMADFSIN